MLERVPDYRLDWEPHAKSMTLGQLAMHVANLPYHHRGQLTVYLRQMGALIPPIYGDTADESAFAG